MKEYVGGKHTAPLVFNINGQRQGAGKLTSTAIE